jgi:hypothetical protein
MSDGCDLRPSKVLPRDRFRTCDAYADSRRYAVLGCPPPKKKQNSQNNDNLGDWLQGENGAILAQTMEEHPSPVCESENDVTLTSQDYGRGSVVYDVGELFA